MPNLNGDAQSHRQIIRSWFISIGLIKQIDDVINSANCDDKKIYFM